MEPRSESLSETLSTVEDDGRLLSCPHNGCGFVCCTFQQGNYILMYPGEADEATGAGKSLGHLTLVEDPHGGHRATCTAKNGATCDDGYKPLDCASYPLFPDPERSRIAVEGFIRGSKCPLPTVTLSGHGVKVQNAWNALLGRLPAVGEWLSKVAMKDYEVVP